MQFPELLESGLRAVRLLDLNIFGLRHRGEAPATRAEEARVVRPVRNQLQMVMQNLDGTLPQDHPARAMWSA